jgi:iron(II)-dependent oxidoreductase
MASNTLHWHPMALETIAGWVIDARRRTLALYADLFEGRQELTVPYLRQINPPLWELGHLGWFQERWVLRHALGRAPLRADADALYDSARVPHRARWDLPLPSLSQTAGYLQQVQDQALEALARELTPELQYFTLLSVFHEDMHDEAFVYTRQTLGLPTPAGAAPSAGPWPGDVSVPGGPFRLGAEPHPAPTFVFDNEKWAHEVHLEPFQIARAPVTQEQFLAFVEDGGYRRRELWTEAGWAWREGVGAEHPLYWRRATDKYWQRRVFERWVPLSEQPHRPVLHVCAHEAEAWCAWAGRRLPTEAEWERAAQGAPVAGNLGLAVGDTVDVAAHPEADSAWGCRQVVGNVWEWTATPFGPYPGYVRDPYAEYSEPWFGDHRVLRGGCFVTQPRLLRPTWRNFYTPDRRDIWGGFRTCARS